MLTGSSGVPLPLRQGSCRGFRWRLPVCNCIGRNSLPAAYCRVRWDLSGAMSPEGDTALAEVACQRDTRRTLQWRMFHSVPGRQNGQRSSSSADARGCVAMRLIDSLADPLDERSQERIAELQLPQNGTTAERHQPSRAVRTHGTAQQSTAQLSSPTHIRTCAAVPFFGCALMRCAVTGRNQTRSVALTRNPDHRRNTVRLRSTPRSGSADRGRTRRVPVRWLWIAINLEEGARISFGFAYEYSFSRRSLPARCSHSRAAATRPCPIHLRSSCCISVDASRQPPIPLRNSVVPTWGCRRSIPRRSY